MGGGNGVSMPQHKSVGSPGSQGSRGEGGDKLSQQQQPAQSSDNFSDTRAFSREPGGNRVLAAAVKEQKQHREQHKEKQS